MQAALFHVRHRRALRPIVAAAAAMASGIAGAQAQDPNPYYIGVRQAITHDSNVYRIPNGVGDNFATTSLLAGFDQPIGRQRLYARGDLSYSKYQDETSLDNTSYGVTAGWDWATIERLSGNVFVSATRGLANRNDITNNTQRVKNVVTADQIGASVRWGGEARLNLEASYSHSRARYSAPQSLASESNTDYGSVGAFYRLSPDLRIGTALRYTRKESPFGVVAPGVLIALGPDDYRSNTTNGRNLDFIVDWRYTEKTGVNARLSYTRETNSAIGARDFSGLTGAIAATYAPTAKLAFSASLSRDANTTSSFFNYTAVSAGIPFTINGIAEGRQTTDTLALAGTYAATAKINVNAGLQYRRGKLVNSASLLNASASSEQNDTVKSASLGATWQITRNWDAACSVARESRSISGTGFSYDANIATCSAQITLR